jgi:hypothetical protein
MRLASDERVQNVPAIELSDRNQVKCGDENPDPACKEPRISGDLVVLGNRPVDEPGQPLQDQRFAVRRESRRRIRIADVRLLQADPSDGQRKHQPRERSADRNVEQTLAVGDVWLLKDHRPHRSERRDRKGDKKRQRGGDSIAPGLKKMAHFVRDENRHHRAKINRPVLEHGGNELGELVLVSDMDEPIEDAQDALAGDESRNEHAQTGHGKQSDRYCDLPIIAEETTN